MHPTLCRLADRGRDGSRLQSVECGLEPIVIPQRYAAADEVQDFIRGRGHQPRRLEPHVASLDDL